MVTNKMTMVIEAQDHYMLQYDRSKAMHLYRDDVAGVLVASTTSDKRRRRNSVRHTSFTENTTLKHADVDDVRPERARRHSVAGTLDTAGNSSSDDDDDHYVEGGDAEATTTTKTEAVTTSSKPRPSREPEPESEFSESSDDSYESYVEGSGSGGYDESESPVVTADTAATMSQRPPALVIKFHFGALCGSKLQGYE